MRIRQRIDNASFGPCEPAVIGYVDGIAPASIRLDRHVKFDAYERAGAPEYWLVDPKARLVEVYTLSNGEYALFGQYTEDDLVESAVLAGLQIRASSLFSPPAPKASAVG